MLRPNHVLYLSCINANKFWYDFNKLFTTSVGCAIYVNLLSKYELSKFDNIEFI